MGRSYYGLYNILGAQFRTKANLQGKPSDHGRLIRYLSQSEDPELQRAGEKLKNLRALRNDADYRMDLTINTSQSELAYEWARQALQTPVETS